jgi:hypothetical protein
MRLRFTYSAGLLASLILNFVLIAFLLGRMGVPPAAGQTASTGEDFVMGTEHTSDQVPTCFVLYTRKPHLLVYRTDPAGQLYLTSSRDIECDLLLPDNHFPRGVISQSKTLPPKKEICKAVRPPNSAQPKDTPPEKEPQEKTGKNGKTQTGKSAKAQPDDGASEKDADKDH